ncbi:MAG: Ldh family oxidoreductase [Bacteriovoracaceae bacterium]|nr:Ldh family oxidoreductase [Bacteriovoracaceae bacterium]
MKIKVEEIRDIVIDLFCKNGMKKSESKELTEILIDSHKRGYPSHGLARVPMYINDILSGTISLSAEIKIIKEAPSTALLDGNGGIGPLQMKHAVKLAIDKAQKYGIGAVALKNSNDIARLGSYVEEGTTQGLITLLFVNDGGALPAVCPTGTTTPFFSTNPIAAGIPTNKGRPIIIDMSTSTVAFGRLKQAMSWNEATPIGWMIERDGTETTDPSSFFRKKSPSAILPLGGLLRGHKGYALSLLVDVLAGGLSGSGLSTGDPEHPESNGVFLLVINPENFFTAKDLELEVGELIDRLKSLPGEVRIPGERQYQAKKVNHEQLELDPKTWDKIQSLRG